MSAQKFAIWREGFPSADEAGEVYKVAVDVVVSLQAATVGRVL